MDQAGKVPARSWAIVAMLFGFMLINFADKAVLGLSAGAIMRDLHLDHTQFGLIGTSFFAFFSLSTVCVGFLVNRIATKWVLLAMAFSWALFQLPMALPLGLGALVANRMLLGLGEGPAYPVALHALYKWFPNQRRPLPTTLVSLGGSFGTGVVAPGIVYVIVTYSWHAAFGLLGAVGLLWCVLWAVVGREGPLSAAHAVAGGDLAGRVPYRSLLGTGTFIGQVAVGFSSYWLLTLAVVWLPAYLGRGFGFSPWAVGWIVTLPALCQIVLTPSLSAWSERLKRRGVSSRVSRGWLAAGGLLAAGLLSVVLAHSRGQVMPIICTALAFSVGTVIFTLGHVMVAEITPAGQRGSMLAINNAIATLAGPLAPVTMGLIVDSAANPEAGYRLAFTLVGAIASAVAIIAMILIDPERDRRRLARSKGAILPGVTPGAVPGAAPAGATAAAAGE